MSEATFLQHGDHEAERRGHERDADEQRIGDEADGVEHVAHREAERDRHPEAEQRDTQQATAQVVELDLQAGQEQQEREADEGEDLHRLVGSRPAEHVCPFQARRCHQRVDGGHGPIPWLVTTDVECRSRRVRHSYASHDANLLGGKVIGVHDDVWRTVPIRSHQLGGPVVVEPSRPKHGRGRRAAEDTLAIGPQPGRLGADGRGQHEVVGHVHVSMQRPVPGAQLIGRQRATAHRPSAAERLLFVHSRMVDIGYDTAAASTGCMGTSSTGWAGPVWDNWSRIQRNVDHDPHSRRPAS